MSGLDCPYKERSKKGMTLLELLIVLTLISIVSAVLSKLVFPKKEDLRKKSPKEALESVIQKARKVANREAKEVRIFFIDQVMNLKIDARINDAIGAHFLQSELGPDRQKSILDFFNKVTNSKLTDWPSMGHTNSTITPLLLATDTDGKAVFDGNEVCYSIIKNPSNGQLTIGTHEAFEKGHLDSSSKWHRAGTPSSRYLTIYPSGLCDSVSFKCENCPTYNHEHVVDSISGTVKEVN
jgi:prepilin-type N-terminal cleavage/methylation domain-containing protein